MASPGRHHQTELAWLTELALNVLVLGLLRLHFPPFTAFSILARAAILSVWLSE